MLVYTDMGNPFEGKVFTEPFTTTVAEVLTNAALAFASLGAGYVLWRVIQGLTNSRI